MKERPEYLEEASSKDMPAVLVTDITDTADKIAGIKIKKKAIEAEVKKLGKEIKEMCKQAAELMAQAGVNDFTTAEGNRITAALFIHGKLANGGAFYSYLKERGEEGLVNVAITGELFELFQQFYKDTQGADLSLGQADFTLHWSRLDSYLRERQEAKEAMPDGVEVATYDTVIIK